MQAVSFLRIQLRFITIRNVTLLADDVILRVFVFSCIGGSGVSKSEKKIITHSFRHIRTKAQKTHQSIRFVSTHACIPFTTLGVLPWVAVEVIRLWPTYGTESSHEWVHAQVFPERRYFKLCPMADDVTRNHVAHDDSLNIIPWCMIARESEKVRKIMKYQLQGQGHRLSRNQGCNWVCTYGENQNHCTTFLHAFFERTTW